MAGAASTSQGKGPATGQYKGNDAAPESTQQRSKFVHTTPLPSTVLGRRLLEESKSIKQDVKDELIAGLA
eukprot:6237373-Amphidinium_carterae.1